MLGGGLDAFVARAALARKAERTLAVQYYLYHPDLAGKLLTGELVDAAGIRREALHHRHQNDGDDNPEDDVFC